MRTSIIILVTAFIIAAYAIPTYAAGDLVAWYKFDETSGTTAFDSSGNGKNATLVNGPTYPAGLPSDGVLHHHSRRLLDSSGRESVERGVDSVTKGSVPFFSFFPTCPKKPERAA